MAKEASSPNKDVYDSENHSVDDLNGTEEIVENFEQRSKDQGTSPKEYATFDFSYFLKELDEKQKEADEYKDAALRALADLENYRKRAQRERSEVRTNTISEVMEGVLPVVDSFEFGLAACERHGSNDIVDGFRMVLSNFKAFLSSYGLETIYPLHEKFDPNFHDCNRRVVHDDLEVDIIVSVDRKGYTIGGKLLRPAAVVVACHSDDVNQG
ncbi:MAG: nucleotide exchange factor GrpE [Puniceicoccales bacterium]|jgi:molecular chaperone GrpE|nr:nucleotide exchange factor GrpE [Puniceicoccales bacterium]